MLDRIYTDTNPTL